MQVLNLTAELEEERFDADPRRRWVVIYLSDYEIGRVEVGWSYRSEQPDEIETAAAVWLAERMKT